MKMERFQPQPPRFAAVEEQRLHIKQRLAASFRLFAKYGFDEGVAGHITARDPEHRNCLWVNPYGMHFSHIRASDLSLVDDQGRTLRGTPPNAAAFAIHAALHSARANLNAAAHAHSMYAKTWSTLRRLLDPLTQDACAFYEDHAIYDEYNASVWDTEEGERIARALGPRKAVIMRNHGHLTVGETVDEAAWWFITMERSCQAQIMAEAAGKPHVIDHENAMLTREQLGTPWGGWMGFQPLYDMIVREQPDLLE
jgi:ribulose-5-phosphate 4-epimerase/fuculose-1-phosphate aldolase